ncbi:MAG: C69 family dipeptidase [Candidatus Bathyarchaeota archaeon]|nr:MAG: C69 family dipeptidase [Candidatus Bathyarchaeota archaeon]
MLQKKVSLLALVLPLLLLHCVASLPKEEALSRDGGCTTALAAGNATSYGTIILAKNRDLSEYEIQWLYRAPREHHPAGAVVRLQYIEIPQVEVTWAWVGSKSYTKKWGIGMGINEWGVVVADNDAPTREPLEGERGLHDNDICRLILERSRTAREGMQVAGALLEEYGHSFVGEIYWIADSEEAWIVEGAGHHWAAVRVTDGVAVRANQFQITTRWDAGSEDLVEYAISRGWCRSAESFNFARCYSKTGYPYRSSQTRFERGHDLLDDGVGGLTMRDLIEVLSDHYEGTSMYRTAHSNSAYRTICSKRTVSAMVAHLKPGTQSEMQVMWYCMSSPCIGVFIPVYANFSAIPSPYLTGDPPEDISGYDSDSAWWAYKKIQLLVDEDYDEQHATVRATWDDLYEGFSSDVDQLEQELRSHYSAGEKGEARAKMDSFVERRLTQAYEASLQTIEELTSVEGVEEEPSGDMPEDGEEKEDKTIVYMGLFIFMALIAVTLWLYVKNAGVSRS